MRSQVSGSPSSDEGAVRGDRRVRSMSTPTCWPGLDGAAGSADPLQLDARLHPPALVEERLVRLELDAVRAEEVGVAEWERGRRRRPLDAEPAAAVEPQLALEGVRVEAATDELVRACVLEREHLQIGAEVTHATGFERADHDAAPPAHLGVEEGIGDRKRHLVPKLRRAHRVADYQHVGHPARDPSR